MPIVSKNLPKIKAHSRVTLLQPVTFWTQLQLEMLDDVDSTQMSCLV